jgi:hypothetical protein
MDMTTWHASDATLREWVDGTSGPSVSASVEQHIVHCEQCRTTVASLVPADGLAAGWEPILAAVEIPRPSLTARCLDRLGVPSSDAMVISAAPVLRAAWVAGLIAVLGFTVLAAVTGGSDAVSLFLAVAPLIPVIGVAGAYRPSADPSYEIVLAAPYPMIRLVLLRTAAVLTAALPLTVLAGLALPISTGTAVAWLLPAAGFTVGVLTASAWIDPGHAALAIGIGWVASVVWATRVGDPLAVLAPLAMLGYLLLLFAGLALLARRVLASRPSWRLI